MTVVAPLVAAGPATSDRLGWVDAARGIGIILVVVGHSLGGLIDSPLGDRAPWLRPAFFALYTFHMPLFFLAAGLFVEPRLARDARGFRDNLWSQLAWPYFLWSIVQFTLIYGLGRLVNTPVERYWPALLALPWQPVSQFWFLHALFQMHLLALLTWRRLGPAAFLMLALSLRPLSMMVEMPDIVRLAGYQLPFYALGVVVGAAGIARAVTDRPIAIRLALVPLAAVLVGLALARVGTLRPDLDFATAKAAGLANLAWSVPFVPVAFAGVAAVLALASLAGGQSARWLVWLGRRSMAVFILHIMAVAGTRIIAIKLGIQAVPVIVLASSLVGLTGPLLAWWWLDRLGWARRLGLG